jgi:Rad3-related DNA helicase
MKELAGLSPRSIILASGTLAPLDSFALEMGL